MNKISFFRNTKCNYVVLGFVILFSMVISLQAYSRANTTSMLMNVYTDLNYGAHAQQKFDWYFPANQQTRPAVILVHGGTWLSGDKQDISALSMELTKQGFNVFNINYRIGGQYPIYEQLQDVQTFIQYVKNGASNFKTDPNNISVFGLSAGGHLAALAGYTGSPVKAVVSWSGPMNLTSLYSETAPAPGCVFQCGLPAQWPNVLQHLISCNPTQCGNHYFALSPINHVSAGDPTTLFVTSDADFVYKQQSITTATRLTNFGVPNSVVIRPGENHANFISDPVAMQQTVTFLKNTLGTPPPVN